MEEQLKPIAILGAGAWGTALALHLAKRGQWVRIWSYEIQEVAAMLAERTNNRYLPGFPFPDNIEPTAHLSVAIKEVDDLLIVVPSIGFRETLMMLKPLIDPAMRITCATKGLDEETGQLLHEVVEEVLGKTHPFAVLSGPSFAREVAKGLPSAVVIASHHKPFLRDLMKRFDDPRFHIHPSLDVIGVELGGVVKNVIAIAAGLADGMELGANARSALITQGLQEIIHLGIALGAKLETFIGLSGMGDLLLTCTDNQSRNRRFGLALGQGHTLEKALHEIGQLVEGKRNAELVAMLAEKHKIAMPLCTSIWQLVQGQLTPQQVIEQCFSSREKTEIELFK